MRRREFITLVGGAAAWPLGARAQQPAATKWRIGTLTLPRRLAMLRQGLRELGYVEGANLVIDVRPADKVDQLAALSAELVALKPDVIVPVGTQAVQDISCCSQCDSLNRWAILECLSGIFVQNR